MRPVRNFGLKAWHVGVVLALALSACGQDIDSRLARAQSSIQQGDYRVAMIDALSILDDRPDHIEARLLLGRASLELGNLADALRHLEAARDGGAAIEAYAVPLAKALASTGDVDGALALLESVPDGVRDADHRSLFATVLVADGQLDAAEALLAAGGNVTMSGPEQARFQVARASLFVARRDLAGAESALARALEVDAAAAEIWAHAADVALRSGELPLAEERLQRAVDLFAGRAQEIPAATTSMQLLRVQLSRQRVAEAENTSRRIAELLPESALAHFASGLVAYERDDYVAAVDALRRAAAIAADPETLTLLGAAHLGAGNLGQAEQQLVSALAAGANPVPVRLLAETRLRQGRPGAAIEALEMLDADQLALDASMSMLLGMAHLENGDAAGAIGVLERAAAATPDSTTLNLLLAQAYLVAGNPEAAARVVESATSLSEDEEFSSRLAIAVARLRQDGPEAARQYGENLLLENPDDPGAQVVAAMLAYLTDEREQARARLDTALRMRPDFIPAHLVLSSLDAESGRYDEARRHLEAVLSLEPGHEGAAMSLARLRLVDDDSDGARSVLRGALRDGSSIGFLRMLGELEYQLGDLDAVLAVARQMKAQFPTDATGHVLEGRVLVDQQRDGEAFGAFRSAYEIQADWNILQAAVFAARRAGIADWESLLRNRLVAEPNDAAARLLLAESMQTTGRPADALAEYESVIRRDASNAVALNNAAWLAHEAGVPRALDYASRARALQPDNPAILDTHGWLLTEAGRADEGLPDLERAVELAPDALEIRYHLAVAQARTGRADAARSTLTELLAESAGQPHEQAARDLLESL